MKKSKTRTVGMIVAIVVGLFTILGFGRTHLDDRYYSETEGTVVKVRQDAIIENMAGIRDIMKEVKPIIDSMNVRQQIILEKLRNIEK